MARLEYDPKTLSGKHRLELALVQGLKQAMSSMRRDNAVRLGGFLGGLIHDSWGRRREIARVNLANALPDLCKIERERIVRRSFVNFAMSMVEFILLPCTSTELFLSLFDIIGFEHVEEALGRGSGVIIVTGHFGSWELAGASFRYLGLPTSFVVGKQKNLGVNAVMNQARASVGLGLIELEEAARGMLKALRANEIICLLADQDAGRDGIFVPFLGRPASTTRGPALFAIKSGAALIPCVSIRTGLITHRIEITKPIYPDPEVPRDKQEYVMMTEFNRRLGDYALKYPEMYYWMHRRFKTLPPETSL